MKSNCPQNVRLTYFTAWYLDNVQQKDNLNYDVIEQNQDKLITDKLIENRPEKMLYRNTNKP